MRHFMSLNVCMSRRPFALALDVPMKRKAKDVVTEPGPGRKIRHCGDLLSASIGEEKEKEKEKDEEGEREEREEREKEEEENV